MKFLTCSMLAIVMLFGGGCATIEKVDDVLVWTKDKLAQVDTTIESVKEKYDTKIAEIEAKQAEDVEELEAALGHKLDADGDDKVSLQEAKQAYLDLAAGAVTDPAKREALMDPNTLLTILMALLGVGGAGGAVALKNANKKDTEKAVNEALPKILEEVKKLNGTS